MATESSTAIRFDDLRRLVFGVLHSHSDADLALEAVADGTPLLEEGLCLDSIDLLDSIVEIEEAMNMRLREEDLDDEAFATAGGFAKYVYRKVSASG